MVLMFYPGLDKNCNYKVAIFIFILFKISDT